MYHRRSSRPPSHVVVDAGPEGAVEEDERPVVGVEDQLPPVRAAMRAARGSGYACGVGGDPFCECHRPISAEISAGAESASRLIGDLGNIGSGTIDTNGNTLTWSGVIADGNGPGVLIKIGTGALTLAAKDTYSGATTVTAGALEVSWAGGIDPTFLRPSSPPGHG